MSFIQVQMVDGFISSDWWKKVIKHFIRVNDKFEIRCWKDETSEINQALSYGSLLEDDNEVSIKGNVNQELLNELLYSPEPIDKNLYSKMTKYFTINIANDLCELSSEHYGTELYINNVSEEDTEFFKNIMLPYWDSFSISIGDPDVRL
ncbi:hypothetical protein [Anaerotignum sp.]|uniref:hypothetical protein n=1 Tax=Anaerotignum sp. TaxID=2039241 RepID=UPI0028A7A627|nr:hypothetical protein [Anaerotignum sp.]